MTRQWRIEYPGALYHIVSRGNEQRHIVIDDQDRRALLSTLGKMCERYEIEMYAYVLMDNHYHLTLRTLRPNLSRALQWFGVTYTRYFNTRHKRSGHLFQGRFRSFLIENDAYLQQVSYYIHRNPVRAGIVKRLADYRWSSYPAYAYGKSQELWLKTDLILSIVSGKDKQAAYRKEMQNYAAEEKRIWEDVKHGLFLGSQEFIDRIKEQFLRIEKYHAEIPQQKKVLKRKDLQGMLKEGALALCWDAGTIRKRRLRGTDAYHRDLLLYIFWDRGLYTNNEIGEVFGLTYSGVSRRAGLMRERLLMDKKSGKLIENIRAKIKM